MIVDLWLLIRIQLKGQDSLSSLLTLAFSTAYWVGVVAALTAVISKIH